MTDEQKDIAQHMREWHEAFRRYGKGDEPSVKVFLEAADMIEKLSAELEQVKRERDAAIADMEEVQGCICQACKHYYQPDPNVRKWSCRVLGEYWADICDHDGGLLLCGSFKWRGPCAENGGADDA